MNRDSWGFKPILFGSNTTIDYFHGRLRYVKYFLYFYPSHLHASKYFIVRVGWFYIIVRKERLSLSRLSRFNVFAKSISVDTLM